MLIVCIISIVLNHNNSLNGVLNGLEICNLVYITYYSTKKQNI